MVPIIESRFGKSEFTKFTNAVCLSCGDDEILRLLLLKHQMHGADIVRGVSPVPSGVQVPEPQLRLKPKLDTSYGAGDLPCYKFKTAPRAFMVEQNSADAEHVIGFAIVQRQVKSCDLADAVWTAGVEWCRFNLRRLPDTAEHLARPRKVKFTFGSEFAQCRKHVMRAVDIDAHGGKAVGEAFSHKALSRQVVALVEIVAAEDVKNAGVAFEAARMQRDSILEMSNPPQTLFGLFERYSSDDSVNLVAQMKQVFGQIAAVLAGYAGDECLLHNHVLLRSLQRRPERPRFML